MVAIFYSLIMNLMLGIRFSPSENELNQHECTHRRDSFSTVANQYFSQQKNVPVLPGWYVRGGFQTNTRVGLWATARDFFLIHCSLKDTSAFQFRQLPMFGCFRSRQIRASRSSFWWSVGRREEKTKKVSGWTDMRSPKDERLHNIQWLGWYSCRSAAVAHRKTAFFLSGFVKIVMINGFIKHSFSKLLVK